MLIASVPGGAIIGLGLMYIYLYGPFPLGGASEEEKERWKKEKDELKKESEKFDSYGREMEKKE